MVTHNPQLAKQYADRIINFSDGKILTDSNPEQTVWTRKASIRDVQK